MRNLGRSGIPAASVGLAVVALLAVNLLAGGVLTRVRADLTAQHLYTLSDSTRALLANLKEPVTLNFYYSSAQLRELPQVRTYADRVRALLTEYAQRSRGMLTLNVVDPAPYSLAEDAAIRAGLRGLPVNGAEPAYFGLAGTNSTDGEEVLPFLSPSSESTLEYDVTRMVYNLAHQGRPKVAVISTLSLAGSFVPMTQARTPPWAVLDQIRALFAVDMLGVQFDAIPPDTDILVIAHPRSLSPQALYQIDQFVLRGGRALVLVDPYSDLEAPPRDPMMPTMTLPKSPSDLGDLLSGWGVAWNSDEVVADPEAARKVGFGADGGDAQEYPAWITLDRRHFATTDPITARLQKLNFATAGALRPTGAPGINFEPLIWAGPNAGTVPSVLVQPPPDLARLRAAIKPAGERQVLAARVRGTLRTAFPDGPPPATAAPADAEGEAPAPPPVAAPGLKESAKPANLLVVADSDFLNEAFWARTEGADADRLVMPFADNGALVVNALDNLAGNDALIGVRSSGEYARPFTVVQELERQAQTQFQARAQELEAQIQATEQRLMELQNQRTDGSALLTPEQQAEIDRFEAQRLRMRGELRAVQRDLRAGIEGLEARLKFANIALVALVIAFGAALASLLRARVRRAPA